jgi:hypothetical protein
MKKIILAVLLTASGVIAYAYTTEKGIFADHTHDGKEPTSHSGGLDKNGGHYDTKTGTYHYHR